MNDAILKIENLSVGYSTPVCSNIYAQVREGEMVGLIGKNGSGKSTLIKTVIGIENQLSGKILINNEDINSWSVQKRAKNIAVVFSRLNQVPGISVFDLVALGRLPYGNGVRQLKKFEIELIENALNLIGIEHLKNKMSNKLSDGQLQMVMIARALVQDTQLVVMDEPTSHLDIENQFKIFELIDRLSKETSKVFIVASHQIDMLLQSSTQIWWIDEGSFHAGYPEQIAYNQKIFDKLSQSKIKFNYLSGRFEFQHHKTKKVSFKGDGKSLSYWLISALDRNGFALDDQSNWKIEVKEDEIRLNNDRFESIEKLINYLKSIENE